MSVVTRSPRVVEAVVVNEMAVPFSDSVIPVRATAVKAVPTITLGSALATTPVCADFLLMDAAMAMALAALVEDVAVTSDAVSSAVMAASIAKIVGESGGGLLKCLWCIIPEGYCTQAQ